MLSALVQQCSKVIVILFTLTVHFISPKISEPVMIFQQFHKFTIHYNKTSTICSSPISKKLYNEVTVAISISAATILVRCIGRYNASSDLTSFPLYCFYIWWSDRTTSCTCLTVQLSTTQLMLQPCSSGGILAGTSSNQYITPSTLHLHVGLKLPTSLHQASLQF